MPGDRLVELPGCFRGHTACLTISQALLLPLLVPKQTPLPIRCQITRINHANTSQLTSPKLGIYTVSMSFIILPTVSIQAADFCTTHVYKWYSPDVPPQWITITMYNNHKPVSLAARHVFNILCACLCSAIRDCMTCHMSVLLTTTPDTSVKHNGQTNGITVKPFNRGSTEQGPNQLHKPVIGN